MTSGPGLLLLDLDGVVVFEHGPPWLERLEILRLHEALPALLARFEAPVVVLTHRSRAEARRILEAAGLGPDQLAGVMAAEDLALAAVRHGAVLRLFGRGLRKSLILPEVEARFGVPRARMALIDDRADNLEDLLAAGLGHALHAPSEVDAAGGVVSFDMAEAVDRYHAWRGAGGAGGLTALTARPLADLQGRRTGLSTTREGANPFNRLRTAARKVRRGIGRLAG